MIITLFTLCILISNQEDNQNSQINHIEGTAVRDEGFQDSRRQRPGGHLSTTLVRDSRRCVVFTLVIPQGKERKGESGNERETASAKQTEYY